MKDVLFGGFLIVAGIAWIWLSACSAAIPREDRDLCTRICQGKPALIENDRGTVKCGCRK